MGNLWRVMIVMHGLTLSILVDETESRGVGAHIHPYVLGRYSS